MGVLDEIAQASAQITETAGSAVVAIGRGGRGSGVVVGEGKILTNAHNLRDRTTTVTFSDGRRVQGTVAGVDFDGDLVVLEADTDGARAIEWADSEGPAAGDVVFALAHPQARGVRATFGTVTATDQTFRGPRGRRISGAFEHTAPLSRGSSGGPVVDQRGRLLGINTSRVGDGFYLAVPAAALRERVDKLARGESVERPRLGVGLAPSHVARRLRAAVGLPERDGVLVQHVDPESPAAAAGLARGDLIVEAAGTQIARPDDLLAQMETIEPQATLSLRVVRGTEEREVAVRFDVPATETGSA